MSYRYILWDVDGTLLNFLAAEREAIRTIYENYGYGSCTDEMIEVYSSINKRYWEALELGQTTKDRLLVDRFVEFFSLYGVPTDRVAEFNSAYQLALGDTIVFCPGAKETMLTLRDEYHLTQAAVTNGTSTAQNKKLTRSGLRDIFDEVYISEDVGADKPSPQFFNRVFHRLGIEDRSEVLIIGDSLTSDIRGGNNAGIDTCWYNPAGNINDKGMQVTYDIRDLKEVIDIVNR